MNTIINIKQKNTTSFRSKMNARKMERWFVISVFLVPSIAAFLIIRYIPLIQSIYDSFFKYSMADPPGKFVGLKNYINVFSSELFWLELANTIILFGYGILFGFFTPIIQALLLNEIKHGKNMLRYLYVLPAGIPGVASIALWKYIWMPDGGLANIISSALGFGTHEWVYAESLVKACLRFPGILGGGMSILIYMVAINNISSDIYEAATVDGANAWQKMWRITLPNIYYIIGIQFLLALTSSLLAFDDVFIMTQGGPGYSSTTLVMGVYRKAFAEQNFGQGMAMSVVILLFTLIFTIIQMRAQDKAGSK